MAIVSRSVRNFPLWQRKTKCTAPTTSTFSVNSARSMQNSHVEIRSFREKRRRRLMIIISRGCPMRYSKRWDVRRSHPWSPICPSNPPRIVMTSPSSSICSIRLRGTSAARVFTFRRKPTKSGMAQSQLMLNLPKRPKVASSSREGTQMVLKWSRAASLRSGSLLATFRCPAMIPKKGSASLNKKQLKMKCLPQQQMTINNR